MSKSIRTVVAMRLAASGLSRRRSKRLSRARSVRLLSSTSSLAVPVITVRFTTGRLCRRRRESLGEDCREKTQEGDGEGSGLHLGGL